MSITPKTLVGLPHLNEKTLRNEIPLEFPINSNLTLTTPFNISQNIFRLDYCEQFVFNYQPTKQANLNRIFNNRQRKWKFPILKVRKLVSSALIAPLR
jgi:hypothetical protein